MAAAGGHQAVAELLLERVAEPDLLDGEGRSAPSLAARMAHCELLVLLVGRGAGPGSAPSPLGHALLRGRAGAVVLLLELGAEEPGGRSSAEEKLLQAA
jgi:hypothetical protein